MSNPNQGNVTCKHIDHDGGIRRAIADAETARRSAQDAAPKPTGQPSEYFDTARRVEVRALLSADRPVPPEYIGALLNTLDFAERYINALHAGWEKADQRNAGIIDGLQRRAVPNWVSRRDGRSRKRVA